MIMLVVKMLGTCPECKKSVLKKIADTNHYTCERCGCVCYALVKWKLIQGGEK